jgi:hypothetical protein
MKTDEQLAELLEKLRGMLGASAAALMEIIEDLTKADLMRLADMVRARALQDGKSEEDAGEKAWYFLEYCRLAAQLRDLEGDMQDLRVWSRLLEREKRQLEGEGEEGDKGKGQGQ